MFFLKTILIADTYLILLTVRLVLWLERRVSISQRTLERNLIGIWAAQSVFIYYLHHHWQLFLLLSVILFWLLSLHQMPRERRMHVTLGWDWIFIRVLLQPMTFLLGLLPPHSLASDISYYLNCGMLTILYYLFAVNFDNKEPRKRKLSWEKIKELFGGSWLPHPSPQENS